jgi:response regulator RpfG family c-di-GMP phosphodiesterase
VHAILKIIHIKDKFRHQLIMIIGYLLSFIITGFVYFTGGTETVFSNFMYLPIIIVTATTGKKTGVLHAVVSALLIGPFMPLNEPLHLNQSPENWGIRLVLYIFMALIIGAFADYHKAEYHRNLKKERALYEAQMATIYSLVKLLESRDAKSGFHVERVSLLCKLLSEKLQQITRYQNKVNDAFIDNLSAA